MKFSVSSGCSRRYISAESRASESPAGVADIDESIVVEVAEQQCADVLACVAGLGEAADDELLPELDLELEPDCGSARRLVTRSRSRLAMIPSHPCRRASSSIFLPSPSIDSVIRIWFEVVLPISLEQSGAALRPAARGSERHRRP